MIDLGREAARELRKLGIKVDWKATFLAFCDAHGGLPVRHEGRLLFADGWQYALDYRGPEYPPPRDGEGKVDEVRLRALQLAYQKGKRRALKMEVDWLGGILGTFDETQRLRSAPLQHVIKLDERDAMGNPKWTSGPVAQAVMPLRERFRWAMRELRACEQQIEMMEYGTTTPAEQVESEYDE